MLKFYNEKSSKHNIRNPISRSFLLSKSHQLSQEERFFEHSLLSVKVSLLEILTNFNQQTPKESKFRVIPFTLPDRVWVTHNPWRQQSQEKLWRGKIINPLSSPSHGSSKGYNHPSSLPHDAHPYFMPLCWKIVINADKFLDAESLTRRE